MEPIGSGRQGSSGADVSAATSNALRPTLNAASRCGTVAGNADPRGRRGTRPFGHEDHRDDVRMHRQGDGVPDALVQPRDGEPAEQGRGHIVRVALESRGDVQQPPGSVSSARSRPA